MFILAPDKTLYFSMRGRGLYDGLYEVRDDRAEILTMVALLGGSLV